MGTPHSHHVYQVKTLDEEVDDIVGLKPWEQLFHVDAIGIELSTCCAIVA